MGLYFVLSIQIIIQRDNGRNNKIDGFIEQIWKQNYFMKRQKSQFLPLCRCHEMHDELSKIRNKLLQCGAIPPITQNYSTYSLLKGRLKKIAYQQQEWEYIGIMLQKYARNNPTVDYREGMKTREIVTSILARLEREKTIHQTVLLKQIEIQNHLTQECRSAAEEIDYLKQLLAEQQKEQQSWKNQSLKLDKQITALRKDLQLSRQQNRLLQQLLRTLQAQHSALQTDISHLSRQLIEKSEQIARLGQKFKSFKIQMTYQIRQQLQSGLSQNNPQNKEKHSNDLRKSLFRHFFAGQVLLEQEQSRLFLVQTLQNLLKNVIVRTKLICRMDPLNPTNLHRYIDGNSHIVILIRTDIGQLIGAYSEGAFKSKVISNKRGTLMNLTSGRAFHNTKKAIIYDETDIIFGNNDLKLRNGDPKLFSNFATPASFYESKSQTVNSLLGEGKIREVRMKYFEVFHLILEA